MRGTAAKLLEFIELEPLPELARIKLARIGLQVVALEREYEIALALGAELMEAKQVPQSGDGQ